MIFTLINLISRDCNLQNQKINFMAPLLATTVESVCMIKQSQNEIIKSHIESNIIFSAAFSAIAEPLKVLFLEGLLPPPINMSPLNLCLFKDGGGESIDEFEMELGESPVPLGYTTKSLNFYSFYSKLIKDYFACINEPIKITVGHIDNIKHISHKATHSHSNTQPLDKENTKDHITKAQFYDNNYWVSTVIVDEMSLVQLTSSL